MEEKENLNKENEEKEKKKGFVAWWFNLSKLAKVGVCAGAAAVLATAITLPIVLTQNNKVKEETLPVVDFYTCSWNDISERCNKLEEGKITEVQFANLFTFNGTPATSLNDFVGKERSVQLNHQTGDIKQTVRVIGTKHDKDENDKTLTLTFEFANLISDKNGYSLAYQWNDTNDKTTANYDYTNSTIRYALTGEGNNGGKQDIPEKVNQILVAQKEQTTWSKDEDYNKTILSMLPSSLTSKLKTVKKSVGVKTADEYNETSYTDKLFMTSIIELGYDDPDKTDKGFGSTYSYYKNATKVTETSRIKKQVKVLEEPVFTNLIQIQATEGQTYSDTVINRAGYNSKTDNTGGGIYWLRSPRIISSDPTIFAFNCNNTGYAGGNAVYSYACGVAPAFCL